MQLTTRMLGEYYIRVPFPFLWEVSAKRNVKEAQAICASVSHTHLSTTHSPSSLRLPLPQCVRNFFCSFFYCKELLKRHERQIIFFLNPVQDRRALLPSATTHASIGLCIRIWVRTGEDGGIYKWQEVGVRSRNAVTFLRCWLKQLKRCLAPHFGPAQRCHSPKSLVPLEQMISLS